MIKIENIQVYGWEAAVRGMRNPMNSWDKMDSYPAFDFSDFNCFVLGPNDYNLAKNLINAGTDHSKFMRMIHVWMDITAPEYWWKEYATYKVGTVENSTSTMHKIQAKEFTRDDFSIEHVRNLKEEHWMVTVDNIISSLNVAREKFLETKDKNYWWQMIQLLPMSYNYRRTVSLSYQNLQNMYHARNNHKLDEWREFCKIIERDFPYSEFITKKFKDD